MLCILCDVNYKITAKEKYFRLSGSCCAAAPGDHTLHVEAPGYKPVRKDVTLKATTPADIKSQTIIIRLEKR
jgi:hypothetical protein